MFAHLGDTHAKFYFTVISLLLLAIVTYAPAYLDRVLAASDTHIAAAGDWGCNSNTAKTVSNVKTVHPQLLLALGDFSYEKTSTCWVDMIKPIDSITKINFGNHEYETDALTKTYLTHFGLSKEFYSFDVNNVHVLTIATEEDFEPDSEQYGFVVNDLRKAANNPDIKWIVVSMHEPLYSSPNGCKASGCEGDKDLAEIYHPLFDKYGVDLVLHGHVHNYQRSFPLKFNQESSSKPLITSSNKLDYKDPGAAIYAIVGTAGVNIHSLSGKVPSVAYQQDANFGILDIHFSGNKLDAKFVSNAGTILDHFSLTKTVKKKVIELVSDTTPTDAKIKTVSAEGSKGKPEIVKDENGKPTITYKLSDETTTTTSTKTKNNPLAEIKEAKPTITYKLSDETTTTTSTKTKNNPLSEIKEAKPTITYKLENPSTDDKPLLLTEKVKTKTQKEKQTISKLGDNPPTDDKPVTYKEVKSKHQKAQTSDSSYRMDIHEPVDDTYNTDSEPSGHGGAKSIITNTKDPFAPLH